MMNRAPTQYRRVSNQGYDGEYDDDVELLPQSPSQDQHWDVSTDAISPKITLESNSSSITTAQKSIAESALTTSYRRIPTSSGQHSSFTGWRAGAILSFAGAASVCIFNISITTYVWTGPYKKLNGSVGTLFEGSCTKTRTLNVWIHLVVNILSTLLLSASNYCMQVLSAPNRDELVRAHGKRVWLHIGVPSLRNLRYIGRPRAFLWLVLFLSSIPLHLLFNSVIFTNMQANEYAVVPATQEWMDGANYDTSGFVDIQVHENLTDQVNSWRLNSTNLSRLKYQRVDAATCFERYNDQYISNSGNVYIVQEGPTVWRNLSSWAPLLQPDGTFIWIKDSPSLHINRALTYGAQLVFVSSPDEYPSNGWQCPSHTVKTCDVSNTNEVPTNRSNWQPFEVPINHCLIEEVAEQCKLHFSFTIAVLVIVSNFIKAVCMALILFMYRRHSPLVTLGDTVAHFLDNPDPETMSRCLFSRDLMEAQWTWERTHGASKDGLGVVPERFDPYRWRWQTAPSTYRWLGTYVLYVAAIIAGIVCIALSLRGMPRDPVKLWNIGFGKITGNNLLDVSVPLGVGVILANTPQAVLSYLYLAFNALYTNMFLAEEWSRYTTQRKPLRVTSPRGQQRSTYWLNVPFRWAIPMTILSGLFHWLASQSIFMVQIEITRAHDRQNTYQVSTCGFSPPAIILCTVVGSILAIGGIVIGRFRYEAGLPVASSCSAAISAACHRPPEDTSASLLPVQWGAVSHGDRRVNEGKEAVGHCTFTSLPVQLPIRGRLYA